MALMTASNTVTRDLKWLDRGDLTIKVTLGMWRMPHFVCGMKCWSTFSGMAWGRSHGTIATVLVQKIG